MNKTNYVFAKRQRDLAKQKKKEEKRQRKIDAQPPTLSPVSELPADPPVAPNV